MSKLGKENYENSSMSHGGSNGTKYHSQHEGPIFEDMTLYKAVKTNKGQTVLIHIDGSASMIIPFESMNCNSYTEEEYVSLFERIKSILEDLDPKDITAQFIMMREAAPYNDELSQKLPSYLQPRAYFLKDLSEQNRLFKNSYYLAVHCQNKREDKKDGIVKQIFSKIKNRNNARYNLNKKIDANFERRVTSVIETSAALSQMLDDIGCSTTILKEPQEYYNILQKFTRPEKSKFGNVEISKEDEKFESPRQALFSGVRAKVGKDDFSLDGYYHKIYTLDRAPRRPLYGRTIGVIDSIPFEFIYSISFRRMDFKETLNVFQLKTAIARMNAGSNEGAIVENRVLVKDQERMEENYDRFAFGDASGIEASVNLVFRVKEDYIDKFMREERISRLEVLRRFDQMLNKQVFARFGASEWVSEANCSWKIFNNLIPGMSSMYNIFLKKQVLVSDNLPYFLCLYDSRMKGATHVGVNHFIDMKDNLVPFDLMNPHLPAWNYSISGQTGSGKSVLMNAILTMQFAGTANGKPPVVCILDVGGDRGSYMKFLTLTGGTQINLSKATKPNIQMLELKPDRSLPTKAKKISLAKDMKKILPGLSEEITEKELQERCLAYFNEKLNLGSSNMVRRELDRIFEECFEVPVPVELYKKDLEEMGEFEYKNTPATSHGIHKYFVLKPGECMPDQNRMNMIMSLLEVILSTSGDKADGFQHFDPDEISNLILETYETIGESEKRYPKLSDLYDYCNSKVDHKEPAARKLLSKIKNWTVDGQYKMFDQETNINTESDVILADLKGLESDKKLQQMYTLLISQMFNDKMYFVKDRRKFIVRDEAWSLMQNPRARAFFVEDLRTARKNGFATIAISQLPTDYMQPDPAVGRAIMSNMQVNIFCKFEGEQVCRLVGQEYRLNDEMIDEMTTLGVQKVRQRDGSYRASYSKFMMLVGKEIYILKNLLHPFEYNLYSSSAEDNALIDYYLEHDRRFDHLGTKAERLEAALWHISQGMHKGDAGLAAFLTDSGYDNKAREVIGKSN